MLGKHKIKILTEDDAPDVELKTLSTFDTSLIRA